MRRPFRACPALAPALALAACQTMSEVADVVTAVVSPSDTEAGTEPEPAPGAATPAAPAVAPAPTGLAGMSAERLRMVWGEPSLKRQETGAELWQYAGAGCTLLIYLYPAAGSALAVSHAEAVPGGAGEDAIEACAKSAGKPPLKPIS